MRQVVLAGLMSTTGSTTKVTVAWRHVNLVGRFDFTSDATDIYIDALVAPFFDPEYWRIALEEDADEASE